MLTQLDMNERTRLPLRSKGYGKRVRKNCTSDVFGSRPGNFPHTLEPISNLLSIHVYSTVHQTTTRGYNFLTCRSHLPSACRRACFTISKGRTSAFLTVMSICPLRSATPPHLTAHTRADTEDLALGDTTVDVLIWAAGLSPVKPTRFGTTSVRRKACEPPPFPLFTPVPQT
jgi:hypothetical protein